MVVNVVLICASMFVGWHLLQRQRLAAGAALAFLGVGLLAITVTRARGLNRLSRLARVGRIAQGKVTGTRLRRFCLATRADGFWPTARQPLVRVLEVRYTYADDRGAECEGRFSVCAASGRKFPAGKNLEIYHAEDGSGVSCPSLVMRWYYRLGGALSTAAAPQRLDFPPARDPARTNRAAAGLREKTG